MRKFVIKSTSRGLYFVAFHSFTSFFAEAAEARRFDTFREADNFAIKELFTTRTAYTIEEAVLARGDEILAEATARYRSSAPEVERRAALADAAANRVGNWSLLRLENGGNKVLCEMINTRKSEAVAYFAKFCRQPLDADGYHKAGEISYCVAQSL